MKYRFGTSGVCAQAIDVELRDDGKVGDVEFYGGCGGHRQAVARLVRGMKVRDVVSRLRGIDCGGRGTSCADQLAQCLEMLAERNKSSRKARSKKKG